MESIKKIYNGLFRVVDALSIFFAVCMVGIMAYNVLMRYVFSNAPSWGDEMSQFCMIWLGLLSASLAMREDRHIRLRFWKKALPAGAHKALEILVHTIVCAVLVALLIQGIGLVELTGAARMSGSRLPLVWLYYSLPVSCVCMLIGAIGRGCEIIGGRS